MASKVSSTLLDPELRTHRPSLFAASLRQPNTNATPSSRLTQNADTSQETFDALLNAIPWRCFHCDFVTSDPAEAEAHFGDKDDDSGPICKWWATTAENERLFELQSTYKELEAERRQVDRQRVAIEGLEYQVDSIPAQIKSYKPFRGCNSIYDVFCVYDSMEGRALAAEERNKVPA